MKAVWKKPRADKEPVSWNTGQRLGLGCLRLVPFRSTEVVCIFKLHSVFKCELSSQLFVQSRL